MKSHSKSKVDQCVDIHNYYRCLHHAPPLQYDDALAESAQMYANYFAQKKISIEEILPMTSVDMSRTLMGPMKDRRYSYMKKSYGGKKYKMAKPGKLIIKLYKMLTDFMNNSDMKNSNNITNSYNMVNQTNPMDSNNEIESYYFMSGNMTESDKMKYKKKARMIILMLKILKMIRRMKAGDMMDSYSKMKKGTSDITKPYKMSGFYDIMNKNFTTLNLIKSRRRMKIMEMIKNMDASDMMQLNNMMKSYGLISESMNKSEIIKMLNKFDLMESNYLMNSNDMINPYGMLKNNINNSDMIKSKMMKHRKRHRIMMMVMKIMKVIKMINDSDMMNLDNIMDSENMMDSDNMVNSENRMDLDDIMDSENMMDLDNIVGSKNMMDSDNLINSYTLKKNTNTKKLKMMKYKKRRRLMMMIIKMIKLIVDSDTINPQDLIKKLSENMTELDRVRYTKKFLLMKMIKVLNVSDLTESDDEMNDNITKLDLMKFIMRRRKMLGTLKHIKDSLSQYFKIKPKYMMNSYNMMHNDMTGKSNYTKSMIKLDFNG